MTFVSNEIDFPNITNKVTPTTSDYVLISDSMDGEKLKKSSIGSLPGGGGSISDVIIMPSYISGNWINPYPFFRTQAIVANQLATGLLFFTPIYFYENVIITDFATNSNNTNVAAHNVVFGIYNSNSAGNQPTGNPIANSTIEFSIIAATRQDYTATYSSPISLNAGIYFLGRSQSVTGTGGAPGTSMCSLTTLGPLNQLGSGVSPASGANAGIFGTYNGSVDAGAQLGWSQPFVYNNILPAVGTLTAVYGTGATSILSAIAFKVQ